MTEKQIKQVKAQLPEGETLNRMYRSYEGDIRVISRDRKGNEHRYTTRLNADMSVLGRQARTSKRNSNRTSSTTSTTQWIK